MKHISVFFCDIMGTLKGKIYNSKNEYIEFNNLLNSLVKEDEKIIFSLVSTDNEYTVQNYLDETSKYLNNKIIFGKQFFESGYIFDDKLVSGDHEFKISQILNYLNELSMSFKIDKVYFADDTKMYHILLSELMKNQNFEGELVNIIPIDNEGLKELNLLIKESINKKQKVLK